MKKYLFFYAVAACVAISSVSCGSDDEDYLPPKTSVTLTEPEYASQAATFEISGNAVQASSGKAYLSSLSFTESGKAIIEVASGEGRKYVTCNVKIDGNTYTITDDSGKTVGTVRSSSTRSSETSSLIINITVTIPGLGSLTFNTDNPVDALKKVETISDSNNTSNIARTWYISNMNIVLEGDIALSKIEHSGNLKVFADAAEEAGAGLTADEYKALSKTIKSVTLDKNGLFSLEYTDGGSEVCTWLWANTDQTKVNLKLRDGSEFGNKFLSDGSNITVDFTPTGCAFSLTTKITGSKTYTATLTIVLK